MGCENGFAIWGPVPAGSQFCAKIETAGADFFVNVELSTETGPSTTLGTAALMQGTCVPLKNEGYGALATVRIGAEATMLNLEMSVQDANGKVLFTCTTQYSTPNTTKRVMVTVVPQLAEATA
jgi:hypothetical protein